MSAYIQKDHNYTVSILHSSTKPSKQSSRKHLPDPDTLPTEVIDLQKTLRTAKLESLKLQMDAALFTRSCMNSDYNALNRVRSSNDVALTKSNQAVITFTVYNRLSWAPSYLSRSSQHCVLSCQNLQDMISAIPCPSYSITTTSGQHLSAGCVICIEDVLYGDDIEGYLYADKVVEHIGKLSKKASHVGKSPISLADTLLSSLTLRLNEPYWMLHFGNCEHFLVIDQVRHTSSTDPSSGYPLTIQLTPTLVDLCRACGRVPASYSVVGDVRLAESPCLLCGPCWRAMGNPEDSDIHVFPLLNPY
ncbi:snRNA-activating protein of 50kDa MW C terminal-domain-containing protein [Cyathus striatus]|nr:snRNA-activating protein of 50kDa MW C terminal-domain-containing protein [Cyathus striatus]